jgi:hypothetical protein
MSFIRLPVSPLLTRLETPASPQDPYLPSRKTGSPVSDQQRLSAIHPVNFAVLNRFLPCIRTSNKVGESEQAGTLLAAGRGDSQPSFGGGSRLARRTQAGRITAGVTEPEQSPPCGRERLGIDRR